MIGNSLQSRPLDVLDVGFVKASEFVPHDPLVGVGVLPTIGERGEGVTQSAEGNTRRTGDFQFIDQGGEGSGNIVISPAFVYPRLSLAIKDKFAVRALDLDRLERRYGFRPQGYIADGLSLSPDGQDAPFLQIHFIPPQQRAVGSAKSTVHAKQDHGLELVRRGGEQLANVSGLEIPALAGGVGSLLEIAHRDRLDPAVTFGMVEHRDNASSLAVECANGILFGDGHIAAEIGEVLWTQVADQTGRADDLEEFADGRLVILQVADGDFPGIVAGFLFIGKEVGKFFQGNRAGIGSGTGAATGVQVMLDPVVFGQCQVAVVVGSEVEQMPQDSLLKPSIGAGLGGESLHCFDQMNTTARVHGSRFANKSAFCNLRHLSIQRSCGNVQNMQKTLEFQDNGSVAQRSEQGTHNTFNNLERITKSAFSSEKASSESAQSPNFRTVGSPTNTQSCHRAVGHVAGEAKR